MWDFGRVYLDASGFHKEPGMYDPLPEIHHIFRKPEPVPSQTTSLLFTGLVFSPLFLLIILVSSFSFLSDYAGEG